jgi:hypothetical protein
MGISAKRELGPKWLSERAIEEDERRIPFKDKSNRRRKTIDLNDVP